MEKMTQPRAENGNFLPLDIDLTPSNDLFYVLGVVKGDGSIGSYEINSKVHYTVRLRVTDEPFAKKFKRKLESLGMNPSLHLENQAGKDGGEINGRIIQGKKDAYVTRAYSKVFVEWYRNLSFQDISRLLSDKKSFKFAFLEGIYESEGSLRSDNRHRENYQLKVISNTDEKLVDLVMAILKSIGYNPHKYKTESEMYTDGIYYDVRLMRRKEVLDFLSHTNPVMERKNI